MDAIKRAWVFAHQGLEDDNKSAMSISVPRLVPSGIVGVENPLFPSDTGERWTSKPGKEKAQINGSSSLVLPVSRASTQINIKRKTYPRHKKQRIIDSKPLRVPNLTKVPQPHHDRRKRSHHRQRADELPLVVRPNDRREHGNRRRTSIATAEALRRRRTCVGHRSESVCLSVWVSAFHNIHTTPTKQQTV